MSSKLINVIKIKYNKGQKPENNGGKLYDTFSGINSGKKKGKWETLAGVNVASLWK